MELELIAVGLVLSLAFAGATGIYAGGIIVPSYLVLFLDQPGRIAGTFVAALAAFTMVNLLSRYVLLFGKRQFVVMILCGALCAGLISMMLPSLVPATTEFRVLGWVVPGLMANTFKRQGVVLTGAAMVVVTVAVYFIGRAITLIV